MLFAKGSVRPGSTFLSLDPEASANLMGFITPKLDDLLIAHKDLVLLTSVDPSIY